MPDGVVSQSLQVARYGITDRTRPGYMMLDYEDAQSERWYMFLESMGGRTRADIVIADWPDDVGTPAALYRAAPDAAATMAVKVLYYGMGRSSTLKSVTLNGTTPVLVDAEALGIDSVLVPKDAVSGLSAALYIPDWYGSPVPFDNREADVILVAPGAQQAAGLEFAHTVHVTLYPGSPGENAVFYGRDASGRQVRNTVALAGGLTAESYQAMATLDRISIPLGAGENCISTFLIQRGRGIGLPEALAQNSIRDVLFNGTSILADCTITVSGDSTSPAGTLVKLPNASSSYEAGSEITVIYERGA
jgi:hypothetical protein